MKTWLVIVGAFLLIGSGVLFLVAYNTVRDYQTPLGQLERALDPEAQADYEYAVTMELCYAIGIIVGIIMVLVGLILKNEEEDFQTPPQPSHIIIYERGPRNQGLYHGHSISSAPHSQESESIPYKQQITEMKEGVKEIVKIRCPRCGNIYNEELVNCPKCNEINPLYLPPQ
ncbi:MAG: hypothetical protein J7K08_06695 [Thermoplasmata archaeon]|nr:hypothetical protein [Thermoplasmata archaeon]